MIIEFQEIDMSYYRIDGDSVTMRDEWQEGYLPKKIANISLTTFWNKFTLDVCSNGSKEGDTNVKRYKAMVVVIEGVYAGFL